MTNSELEEERAHLISKKKSSELPMIKDEDQDRLSPEQAANRAVNSAFDKHKYKLEQELKKLIK